ncbi:hypothetical protein [Bosea sp. (in: a-proteobacteria)]|uniref:hypothetical protein n=1 Tax=Bosea sp. (in: a-proteobacteria) TaxID=1871050 RepID=UPI003B3AC4B3
MPIILPEPYEPTERVVAISDVAEMIEDAMMGDEEVDLYFLAEEIVDRLQPPARSGPPLAAMREWQNRFEASTSANANVIPLNRPKPRIKVRAATQHTV